MALKAEEEETMTDSVPEKLGKYKIIEEVGRGGFAAVYKAVDTTLDRTVALKVLAPHLLWDPTFVQRFQQEAKVAANLDHSNIVTIYEVGQIEGVYFIAMQFLEGRTLSQILGAGGPLPVSRVQAIIEQIASALDYAHARGLVHRDIKPSNVMVADDGRATLTDFGLVKAGEGTHLTASGVVFGTPEYMSPEQAEGKVLDARSDIYSLGVVLYEMLAGRAPFVADTTPAVMYKHVHEPPPLEELPSDLPQGVVAVVEKALAKKQEERYRSAGEMAQALKQAIEAGVEVTPAPPQPEVPVPPPVMKPAEEKGVPPPVEPVAVVKEEPQPPIAPPAAKAVPKRALRVGALVAGGLVLVALVACIAVLAIIWPWPTPTPEPSTTAPVVRVTPPAPTVTPTTMPIPPTDTSVPLTDTPPSVPPTDTPPASAPSLDMVHVPAGGFIMGSSDADVDNALAVCEEVYNTCQRGWFEDGQPQHTVYLDAFYIDKTEVTTAQFVRFLNEQGNQEEGGVPWLDIGGEDCPIIESGGQYESKSGYSDHPVVEVSWYGARAYCQWAGKRLPTEAEWEKAARGTDGQGYPWGNAFDGSKLNFCDKNCSPGWKDASVDDGYTGTAPVDIYPAGASPYGALDMAGNVWEWVADWYDRGYYTSSPESNPKGPASGSGRIVRGGSWRDNGALVRADCRAWLGPDYTGPSGGFRCAR
jgi:formylglycine-generating enzyme required for sulfatase activity/predicted Ser/Thr protein kinase